MVARRIEKQFADGSPSPKPASACTPATRAGAFDEGGREALLKYILRPPLASERLLPGPDGLARIALTTPFGDGTVAVDLDPVGRVSRNPARSRKLGGL